jgi:tocopherol O-methyltransferase
VWTALKQKIQRHYDIAAPLYREHWGIHIHHGYWRAGTESKDVAQEQLIDLLAEKAEIANGSSVLDVGCGFGGSAKYLSERFGSHVVGISISSKQIQAAVAITQQCNPPPRFVVMDAEYLGLRAQFDLIWSIEAISHLAEKRELFKAAYDLLQPNGRIAIVDWFKAEDLSPAEELRYIDPIVERMFLPRLDTMRDYVQGLQTAGYRIVHTEDISSQVKRTWDLCLDISRTTAALWQLAFAHGSEFVSFLLGFAAMKRGFASGAFRFGVIVGDKNCRSGV